VMAGLRDRDADRLVPLEVKQYAGGVVLHVRKEPTEAGVPAGQR
jgi:hypothetical protein